MIYIKNYVKPPINYVKSIVLIILLVICGFAIYFFGSNYFKAERDPTPIVTPIVVPIFTPIAETNYESGEM